MKSFLPRAAIPSGEVVTVTLQTGAEGDLVLCDRPGRQRDRAAVVGEVTDGWRAMWTCQSRARARSA